LIALSSNGYRVLLACFPARFRSQYGAHMVQVFRDACLRAYRERGPAGLAALWALALFDWFKIMLEERFLGETDMTRAKFIRASGWGLVLAGFALLLTFAGADDIEVVWYRLFGAPTTASSQDRIQLVTGAFEKSNLFFVILLITLGLVGLRLRYGEASAVARAALDVGIAGGSAALFCISGVVPALAARVEMRNSLMALMFMGMVVFGVAALRGRLMPRGNFLPVLAGIWWPLLAFDSYVYPLGIGRLGPEVPFWFTVTIFLLISIPLGLLGTILQSEARHEIAAA
jgi:hypothetical protein